MALTIQLVMLAVGGCGSDDESDAAGSHDKDGDGFLDNAVCTESDAGVADGGSGVCAVDCYDDNASARPGQTQWFDVDRGDGSFDYDCDGVEERQWSEAGGCVVMNGNCTTFDEGWEGGIAACGASGQFIVACGGYGQGCITESRVQTCR